MHETEVVAVADRVVKPIDAAQRLGVSLSTVYIMMRSGELASQVVLVDGNRRPKLMVLASAVEAREARR